MAGSSRFFSAAHVLSLIASGPLLLLLLLLQLPSASALKVGINYGQIANNLPSPTRVSSLLQSLNISRVKLYDADPKVLTAFSGTPIEFIVGIGNEDVPSMTDPLKAQSWLKQHVVPFIPATRIMCVTVGNEILSGNDTQLMTSLLPAMQSVHQALVTLGLDGQVNISTAHSLNVLGTSYPPSAGTFTPAAVQYLQPLLSFHAQTKSPFLINAYPYFAYKSSPSSVPLDYVLFRPNAGVTDPGSGLHYDNMLYAQIDSVYSAIKALGHTDVDVRVSETGWPSKGDPDEAGATPENAGVYNGNLMQRISNGQGTPLRPASPVDIYVFALFNEDLKPGPASERNYGLFYPDGTPVYNIGLQGHFPVLIYSAADIGASSVKIQAAYGAVLLSALLAAALI